MTARTLSGIPRIHDPWVNEERRSPELAKVDPLRVLFAYLNCPCDPECEKCREMRAVLEPAEPMRRTA